MSRSDSLNTDKCHGDNTKLIDGIIEEYTRSRKYVPVKNVSMDVDTENNIYKFIRLNDDQFYELHNNSIPIFDDYGHLMSLNRYENTIFPNFSKIYVTLKKIFGESGKYYDDWKNSFSFPFLIYFKKDEEQFVYLMNIFNIRSSIEFSIRKVIHIDDETYKKDVLHDPFEEFPREEINYFIEYLAGYLTGYFKSLEKQYDEPFFKTVESNLILFGYKDGSYFDDQYDNEEEFHQAIRELKGVSEGP